VRSWSGELFDHQGPAYTLRDQLALPLPLQQPHPPLVLGGTVKRRFAALAARYATEVNTLGAPDEELRARKDALDRACTEAGRDPATLGFSVMTACFLGETDADVQARVGRFLAVRGDGGPPAELIRERRDRWLIGTVDEVAERIEGLRTVGVSRVLLQHLNDADDDMLALAGERLLSVLR
jgi:alkanesulfonate monooxygenase SsuD/methylene tetrahydromethanopterin reductase-like flavin-dependent oxidoreductase (luciferase family)